ncbi:type II secretion system protein N [Sulfitobacter guttiformis]|uniref:Type II secretion system protein C (GspC) n=1 Tax=Sulfitobacter guttiformis TaxID=74349 RepID=A0A420DTP6_9RHOB|nr:type II secretion system protein N [Sulfitobacter guttiformis]KIN71067.1 Type II secretion system protein C [Sulfitobacter guttiformis KCTC 32187]RKE97550.1 type II secretion system protein C (GspC) [Sulfitobacter guttiformis]
MTAPRVWMLSLLLVAVFFASATYAVLQLVWHRAGHTSVMPLAVVTPEVAAAQALTRDVDSIVALAPFGQVISLAQTATEPVARTSVNLALRGVLVDPDPAQSRAFILVDGSTSVFSVGDDVEQTELVAINADTITLKSGDELIVLGFSGVLGAPGSTQVQTDQAPVDETGDPFARLAAALIPGNGSIDLRDAPPPETTEEYINQWRDRITQNPQAAMESVGVELVENGYRVKTDPDIGVTLAGLKAGDVITRLNGQTVGDLDSDKLLYDEVAAAGIARLEVVRNGQALLLSFPLR